MFIGPRSILGILQHYPYEGGSVVTYYLLAEDESPIMTESGDNILWIN